MVDRAADLPKVAMSEAAVSDTKELEITRAQLSDREWRLDNLYTIRDEEGQKIKFVRREAQRQFDREMWYRNVIPKARKIGFSTYIAIFFLDECFFRGGTVSGIVDRTLDDAESKLQIIRFAYENMAPTLRDHRKLIRSNDRYLEWDNGSTVSVGLTYRGDTPRLVHASEFGKVSVDSPEQAREIYNGAILAVPKHGFVFVESTAHGTGGKFCEMVREAETIKASGRQLTHLDFRSHFYGWYRKPEYRVPNHLVVVTAEMQIGRAHV